MVDKGREMVDKGREMVYKGREHTMFSLGVYSNGSSQNGIT